MKVTLVVLLAVLALESAAREATDNDTEKRELNEQSNDGYENYNSHSHGYYYPVHQPTVHYPYFMTPYPTHRRPTSYPTGRPPVPKPIPHPTPYSTHQPPTPYPIQHNPYDPPIPYNPPIHIYDPYNPHNDHQNDPYNPHNDHQNDPYNPHNDHQNDPYNPHNDHQNNPYNPPRVPTPHPTPHPTRHPTAKYPTYPTARHPTYKPILFTYESNEPSEQPTESLEPSEEPTMSLEPSENPTISDEPSEQPTDSLEPSENPDRTDGPTNAPTVTPDETIFGTICLDGFGEIFGVFCQLTQLFPDVAALLGQAPQPTTRVDHDAIMKRVRTYLKEKIPAERKLNDGVFESVIDHDNQKRSIVYNSNLHSGTNLYGGNEFIPGLTPVNRMDGVPIQQFTVFAPTNYAFLTIPDGLLAEVLKPENQDDQLKPILLHHVIANARIAFDDLDCDEERVMEALGRTITRCPNNGFKYQVGLGNAMDREPEIVYKDKEATNGIIQTIDEVILPDPSSLTPIPTGSPTMDP